MDALQLKVSPGRKVACRRSDVMLVAFSGAERSKSGLRSAPFPLQYHITMTVEV